MFPFTFVAGSQLQLQLRRGGDCGNDMIRTRRENVQMVRACWCGIRFLRLRPISPCFPAHNTAHYARSHVQTYTETDTAPDATGRRDRKFKSRKRFGTLAITYPLRPTNKAAPRAAPWSGLVQVMFLRGRTAINFNYLGIDFCSSN